MSTCLWSNPLFLPTSRVQAYRSSPLLFMCVAWCMLLCNPTLPVLSIILSQKQPSKNVVYPQPPSQCSWANWSHQALFPSKRYKIHVVYSHISPLLLTPPTITTLVDPLITLWIEDLSVISTVQLFTFRRSAPASVRWSEGNAMVEDLSSPFSLHKHTSYSSFPLTLSLFTYSQLIYPRYLLSHTDPCSPLSSLLLQNDWWRLWCQKLFKKHMLFCFGHHSSTEYLWNRTVLSTDCCCIHLLLFT